MNNIIFNRSQDKVFICAPASGGAHLYRYLEDVVMQFNYLGFECIVPSGLFNDNQGLRHQDGKRWLYSEGRTIQDNAREDRVMWCANTLTVRTAHFKEALERNDVKLILFLKGGYGSGEVAYELDRQFMDGQLQIHAPKVVIAYSDGTFMLNYLVQQHGLIGIHGPMITELARTSIDQPILTINMQRLHALLSGNTTELSLQPLNNSAFSASVSGKLGGGNLTCLCSSIGTSLQFIPEGKILVLEDIHSKGYKITRDLIQLKQANILNKVQAIIFGSFNKGDDYHTEAIINIVLQSINQVIPCFSSQSIGHTHENTHIPFGQIAKIDNQKLIINSPFQII